MKYRKRFEPGKPEYLTPAEANGTYLGDRRDGAVYVYTDKIVLAVNVALATGRPLLVRGSSGNGKSSLAQAVARSLGRRYYETVVTSRTQARDVLWEVDLLLRLHDAQIKAAMKEEFSKDMTPYIKPGVLWWGFDRASAKRRGQPEKGFDPRDEVPDPGAGADDDRAVVLIDEIDKADPDVPNNLLVPLGSLEFKVEETLVVVRLIPDKAPLIFITTNDERELPAAFLRRCIEVHLLDPGMERLVRIGMAHFPNQKEESLTAVATALGAPAADQEPDAASSNHVSTAEFLDTVRASVELELNPGDAGWPDLMDITFAKRRGEADTREG